MDAAVVVTVVDAAAVVRAVDAAEAVMVDAGVAIVVVVAFSVLHIDSNAKALPDGSCIAATIAGMSSVVNSLGAVFERRLWRRQLSSSIFMSSDIDCIPQTWNRKLQYTYTQPVQNNDICEGNSDIKFHPLVIKHNGIFTNSQGVSVFL